MPGSTDRQVTRIPVGIAAYCAPAAACHEVTHVGSGGLKGVRPDGTAISNYRLASLGGSTDCELAGFQLRPVGRAAAHTRAVGVSTPNAEHAGTYVVEWAASSIAAEPLLSATERGTRIRPLGSWSISDNWDGAVWRSGHDAAVASGQLRSLQAQLAAASASPLCLRTVGSPAAHSGPGYAQSSDAVASAWAMWRVAAQEQPGARLEAYGFDPNAALVPDRLPATDSFGASVNAGVWLAPQLTAAHSSQHDGGLATKTGTVLQLTGCVLVTGGLGELGLLAGLWLAETSPAAHAVLLSRSGRAATLPAAAARSLRPLTAVRCDVACSEDLAAVVTELQLRGVGPVQAVFHAGGITQVGWVARDPAQPLHALLSAASRRCAISLVRSPAAR